MKLVFVSVEATDLFLLSQPAHDSTIYGVLLYIFPKLPCLTTFNLKSFSRWSIFVFKTSSESTCFVMNLLQCPALTIVESSYTVAKKKKNRQYNFSQFPFSKHADALIARLWFASLQKIKYQHFSCEDECNPIILTSTCGQRNFAFFLFGLVKF